VSENSGRSTARFGSGAPPFLAICFLFAHTHTHTPMQAAVEGCVFVGLGLLITCPAIVFYVIPCIKACFPGNEGPKRGAFAAMSKFPRTGRYARLKNNEGDDADESSSSSAEVHAQTARRRTGTLLGCLSVVCRCK
jgi:hypothetical protein